MLKHCPEDTLALDLHCGYKKTHVEEFLFEAEDYESRGIQPKAQKMKKVRTNRPSSVSL